MFGNYENWVKVNDARLLMECSNDDENDVRVMFNNKFEITVSRKSFLAVINFCSPLHS